MQQLRYFDFFAGAGLVRLALDGPWTCAWANDIDPRKAAIYAQNFEAAEFELGDIADIDASQLPTGMDLAWASFPCQDLSLAGWRRGMSARRSGTFWAFWRLMRDLFDKNDRPRLMVIENVVGMLYGENFAGLCQALAALGMQFGAVVLDARWFIPQSRPRVFIIALDARFSCSDFIDLAPEFRRWNTKRIWSAYHALSPEVRALWRWWKLPDIEANVPSVDSLIEVDPKDVPWHSAEETQRLIDMMAPLNRSKLEHVRARPGRTIGFVYRRTRDGAQRAEVRFDGIAGCLRTPQGGSSRQIVLVIEDGTVRSRLLSSREAARLMGVPDWYRLPGNYNDAYRALGDGVAVPAVKWLNQNLLTPLARATGPSELHNELHSMSAYENLDYLALARRSSEQLALSWDMRGDD